MISITAILAIRIPLWKQKCLNKALFICALVQAKKVAVLHSFMSKHLLKFLCFVLFLDVCFRRSISAKKEQPFHI